MKLSVIAPSIRTDNIPKLLHSIYNSYEGKIELIVIGPYPPIFHADIKWIPSQRSPNAAQQQGLLEATGEYVTFAADDGIFLPNALDEAMNAINFATSEDDNADKFIVVGRYLEGDNPIGMTSQDYYRFKYHKPYRLAGINPNWLIFNCGIISRKFLLELGGWDTENFETTTCAHADLGIRALKAGARMILTKEPMFKCSHQPGRSGDHGPVHNAMVKRDLPRFQEMYAKPNDRVNIDINNWENTPEVWKERFK